MTHSILSIIYFLFALLFGTIVIFQLPTVCRVLLALCIKTVKWPGPVVIDPDQSIRTGRARMGLSEEHLFPSYIWNLGVVFTGFAFSLLSYRGLEMGTMIFTGGQCIEIGLLLIIIASAFYSMRRMNINSKQIRGLLHDVSLGVEARSVKISSAESEYAIEHPDICDKLGDREFITAFKLYKEGIHNLQGGNRWKGNLLNQEALGQYPDLHKHARELLLELITDSTENDLGPIYYWIAIHSENLREMDESLKWYQKAIEQFEKQGYWKREGRIHCNVGKIYLQKNNYERAISEFEEAVRLNESDGMAYFNMGMIYYRICDQGDEKYDKAIDAFAHAIRADPKVYASIVLSRMKFLSYSWKEDFNMVMQKASLLKGGNDNRPGK